MCCSAVVDCTIFLCVAQLQSDVICWLLDHNPHRRPTAEALLQSEYIPPKMEDKELLEVHLMWLGWGWACRRCILCGWDGDGPVRGASHVVGMGMGLSEVHLMWLGWGWAC